MEFCVFCLCNEGGGGKKDEGAGGGELGGEEFAPRASKQMPGYQMLSAEFEPQHGGCSQAYSTAKKTNPSKHAAKAKFISADGKHRVATRIDADRANRRQKCVGLFFVFLLPPNYRELPLLYSERRRGDGSKLVDHLV